MTNTFKWRLGIWLAAAILFPTPVLSAAPDQSSESLHGDAWAFGQSMTRKDAIWHNGVAGEQVLKKGASSSARKQDTRESNDHALENPKKNIIQGSLGVSMSNESSSWKVSPQQKNIHADERIFRDKKHVLRAFGNVKAGDNLNISVGPELILKDEQHGEESATENQPDSSLGIGMKFKLDF